MRSDRPCWRALVLGGARSGKSAFAERLLAEDPEVLYAATAPRYQGDEEWAERIARHREHRPASWQTVEVGDTPDRLAALLRTADRTVLVDSLTLWLTAAMDAVGAWDDAAWGGKAVDDKAADDKAVDDKAADDNAANDKAANDRPVDDKTAGAGQPRIALGRLVSDLVDAYATSASSVVVVSDEIGFGVVPESAGTRRFRDELGRLNQAFAAAADDVCLVVAGLALRLKPGPGALGPG